MKAILVWMLLSTHETVCSEPMPYEDALSEAVEYNHGFEGYATGTQVIREDDWRYGPTLNKCVTLKDYLTR